MLAVEEEEGGTGLMGTAWVLLPLSRPRPAPCPRSTDHPLR